MDKEKNIKIFESWLEKHSFSYDTDKISDFYEISNIEIEQWADRNNIKRRLKDNNIIWSRNILDKFLNPNLSQQTLSFLKWLDNNQFPLETKYIAKFCGCSVRLIEKHAKIKNVYRGGKRYYIWGKNDEVLNEIISIGLSRARVKKERKAKEITPRKKGYLIYPSKMPKGTYTTKEVAGRRRLRAVEKWADENSVPYVIENNRKYYIWSQELKDKYKERHKHYGSQIYKKRIYKHKKYGSINVLDRIKHNDSNINIKIINKWAKQNGVPYIKNFKSYSIGKKYDPDEDRPEDEKVDITMYEYDLVFPDRIEHKKHRDYVFYHFKKADNEDYFNNDDEPYHFFEDKNPYCWDYELIKKFEDWYKTNRNK